MTNLDVKLRQVSGTSDCIRLREEGMTPGVIYGGGGENVMVSLNTKELTNVVMKGLANFSLTGEVTENVRLQDVQYDGLGSTVLHVDFVRA